MTTTYADPAVQLIALKAADGHTAKRIADFLTSSGLLTNTGRKRWHGSSVERMAKANDIAIKHDPGKVRAAVERDRVHATS